MSVATAPGTPESAEPVKSDNFPAGIPYIVGNETAERFSYYGMRAILWTYLAALFVKFVDPASLSPEQVADADARSTEIAHLFMAGVYLFPLVGAVLADRLLGKYKVILWVSLIYCAGHAVLAVAGRFGETGEFGLAEMFMYLGLLLIAVGSGGIKPCVSANVGDQFTKTNGHLVERVFQIFYFVINLGSFFATLLIPLIYADIGAELAFGIPGILMGIATLIFWLGRKRFIVQKPNPGGRLGLLDTLTTLLFFSPIFALVIGFFVLREHFEQSFVAFDGGAFTVAGLDVGARLVQNFLYYLPLLATMVGLLMLGVALFRRRQKIKQDTGFLAMLVYSFKHRKDRAPGQGFFDPARKTFGQEAGDGPPAVLRIMLVFSMISVFWALFDQHASTWVKQARSMDLTITVPETLGRVLWPWLVIGLALLGAVWLFFYVSNKKLPKLVVLGGLGAAAATLVIAGIMDATNGVLVDVELKASQIQALNPLLVMIIIPLLEVGIWQPLKRRGVEVKTLLRMTVGMFLAAVAFVLAAMLQSHIDGEPAGSVPVLYQLGQYFIMTVAEVLVSATGLAFAYTQAPRAMKSTIMGFWLLCVTFGNLIVAFLAPLQKAYGLADFFWVFAALMGGAAIVFMVLASFYKPRTYLQS